MRPEPAPPDHMIPRCAMCGRRVERISWWYDPYARVQRYAVECHGEREEAAITSRDLLEGLQVVAGGEAFTTRRLTKCQDQ